MTRPDLLAREAALELLLPFAAIAPMLAAHYRTFEAEARSAMLMRITLMMIVISVIVS